MSTKNQKSKTNNLTDGVIGYLSLGEEDFKALTMHSYMCLAKFQSGDAMHAERQAMLIRIYAGMQLLLDFKVEGGGSLLYRALMVVNGYRPQGKKLDRKLNDEQADLLKQALTLIDELFSNSPLWNQTLAYKYGEDKVIVDSDKSEYVLMTVH